MSDSESPGLRDESEGICIRRVIVLAVLLGAALIGGAMLMILSERNKIRSEAAWAEHRFGLRQPVPGRLADGFTDADRDLVADPPASDSLQPDSLTFSYIASGSPEGEAAQWQPFVARLSEAVGLPVEYRTYDTVSEQLAALKQGALHVTALNTGNVPRGVNECGFVPVSVKADGNGEWRITMKLIVPSASPIRDVADLRNRSVTFTNPSSFSGFKLAVVLLQNDFGLRLGRDYEYRFSTSHDESIRMVANGEQESATVASDLLQAALDSGRIHSDQVRVVYESTPFPAAAFGFTWKLAPELADKVRGFLVGCDMAGTPIAPEGQGGTLVATHYREDWQAVREVDAAMALDEPAPLKTAASSGPALAQRTNRSP